jgi:hypothetical protein
LGKPYASELQQLSNTYTWAMQAHAEILTQVTAGGAALPLISIGSGGSLTAAHFAAALHEHYTGQIAKAVTPLDAVSALSSVRTASVLMLSAGGRNPDIIGAFKKIAEAEPARLTVVCSRGKSPLVQLATIYRYANAIDFPVPAGKDGFLATNSLLAFMVLLFRAYATAFSASEDWLPNELKDLVHPSDTKEEFVSRLEQLCAPLWTRENLIILYGPATRSVAIDFESKFTEAALGVTLSADYRNFAHGRHHWLAKRGSTTAVLALVTTSDQHIADKTLDLLPKDVPVARFETKFEFPIAPIALLVSAFYAVKFAGEARGIDPGRPGVPTFGRKIYNLKTFSRNSSLSSMSTREIIAIERKTGTSLAILQRNGEISYWRNAYREFIDELQQDSFNAIVFDYDGTLCDGRERYSGLSEEITAQLTRLIKTGLLLGIATGRGKSAREDLRNKLARRYWPLVYIGYYNGAIIGALNDTTVPAQNTNTCGELVSIAETLKLDPLISRYCECTFRRMQITIEMKSLANEAAIWNAVQQIIGRLNSPVVTALRSSHSLDILAPGVSKRNLVKFIRQQFGDDPAIPVLCIGDKGCFPGNDYLLLQEPCSLSVDETSRDPRTCWNLAPSGYRGVQATDYYLQALAITSNGARIRLT